MHIEPLGPKTIVLTFDPHSLDETPGVGLHLDIAEDSSELRVIFPDHLRDSLPTAACMLSIKAEAFVRVSVSSSLDLSLREDLLVSAFEHSGAVPREPRFAVTIPY